MWNTECPQISGKASEFIGLSFLLKSMWEFYGHKSSFNLEAIPLIINPFHASTLSKLHSCKRSGVLHLLLLKDPLGRSFGFGHFSSICLLPFILNISPHIKCIRQSNPWITSAPELWETTMWCAGELSAPNWRILGVLHTTRLGTSQGGPKALLLRPSVGTTELVYPKRSCFNKGQRVQLWEYKNELWGHASGLAGKGKAFTSWFWYRISGTKGVSEIPNVLPLCYTA